MKFQAAVEIWVEHLLSHEFKERVLEEDPTMLKHIPILAEINRHGFVTNNSQAGRKHGKQAWEIWERAFLNGFMLQSQAVPFIKEMALHTDKVAQVLHPTTDKATLELTSALNVPLTLEKNKEKTETHMPNTVSISQLDRWRKECHIDKTEKIVFVVCYDLTWNRSAVGAKGLFKEILRILKKIEDKPKNKTLKKKNLNGD